MKIAIVSTLTHPFAFEPDFTLPSRRVEKKEDILKTSDSSWFHRRNNIHQPKLFQKSTIPTTYIVRWFARAKKERAKLQNLNVSSLSTGLLDDGDYSTALG
jgi:hypothetical protein